MQQELKTQSTDLSKRGAVFIRGIDKVLKKDLVKHQGLLLQSRAEQTSYKMARSHEIKKKKYYSDLLGSGKYDDESLRLSMKDIAINIRHMGDKVKISQDAIKHHTLIVDTLTKQIEEYDQALLDISEMRNNDGAGN